MRGRRPRWWRWEVLAVAAALLQPDPLAASSPSPSPADAVAAACARLEEIFAVPSLEGHEASKQRMRAIQRFIADHLDVAEMGKRTLGIHWQRWPERQAEIVSAFADFLGDFVAEIFATYGSVKIVSIRELLDGDFSRVEGRAILHGGIEAPVAYRLHWSGGGWRIYDVLLREVSLVSHYRSRFGRILDDGSVEALLRRLQERGWEKSPPARERWLPILSLLLLSPAQNVPPVQ